MVSLTFALLIFECVFKISNTKGAADGAMLNVFKPSTYNANPATGSEEIYPQSETSILFLSEQSITFDIALSTAG